MRYVFLFLISFLVILTQAQTIQAPTFQAICQRADSLFANDKAKLSARDPFHITMLEENDYKKFKRWEWYWRNRILPNGMLPDLAKQQSVYMQYNNASSRAIPTWKNISQVTALGGYDGMGRVNCIAFHPFDIATFYVAGVRGGVWKTTNGGSSYIPIGDELPNLAVGDIVVNPKNPNEIYVTLGGDEGWWQYGLGVYKTTDGGTTWLPTGMLKDYTDKIVFYELIINPQNPQTLWLACTDGLYQSVDAGNTWMRKRSGAHRDVRMSLADTSIIYASTYNYWGSSEVFRSTNAGSSFAKISNFNTYYNTVRLSTTALDSNLLMIYTYAGNNNRIYWYENNVMKLRSTTLPFTDAVILSNTNKAVIYCGQIDIYKSTDTGATWKKVTNWYDNGTDPTVHADQRFVTIHPLTNEIFWGNDGGVYKYNELSNVYTELNDQLRITQFYRIACSQQDSVYIIGGTQDNGGRQRISLSQWRETNGGDAMDQAVNPVNDQTIYTEYYDGMLYRSRDKWTNDVYHEITPDSANGSWVTPFTIAWSPTTLVAAYKSVFISYDEGDNWSNIGNYLAGNEALDELGISIGHEGTIYVTNENTIYHTYNYGANWDTTYFRSPDNYSVHITSITPDVHDSSEIWITLSGYIDSLKVMHSRDAGATWENLTWNLPNVPANCLVIDTGSHVHDMYVGTDVGVFYKNDTLSQWQYYGRGLPNTSVTDFAIFYPTGLLRAATYGRGIWEMKLNRPYASKNLGIEKTLADINLQIFPNPAVDRLYISRSENTTATLKIEILNVAGQSILQHQWPAEKNMYEISLAQLTSGIYFLKVSDGKAVELVKRVAVVR